MKSQPLLAAALAAIWLTGCAGGAMLAEPVVTNADVNEARHALANRTLASSLDMPDAEMASRLERLWRETRPSVLHVCGLTFSSGCEPSVQNMYVRVVADDSVNAYANSHNFEIGFHAGLMRAAGSDDELVAVLAHETAHLLFAHGPKKQQNANASKLLGGLAGAFVGGLLYQPGMDTRYIDDMTRDGMTLGYELGYTAYSPEMELEADQFAMYVLAHAGRRLTAGTDMILRLNRGFVPSRVRQGDGWAGYLNTHPANDYRLARPWRRRSKTSRAVG